MNSELINMYIEQLIIEITEAAKLRVLLQTQLKYMENVNRELQTKVKQLEIDIETLNKKNQKEVDTSIDTS